MKLFSQGSLNRSFSQTLIQLTIWTWLAPHCTGLSGEDVAERRLMHLDCFPGQYVSGQLVTLKIHQSLIQQSLSDGLVATATFERKAHLRSLERSLGAHQPR